MGPLEAVEHFSCDIIVVGYEATLLTKVCKIWCEAYLAGVLDQQQFHKAEIAEAILWSTADVGIIVLVDEASGYYDPLGLRGLYKRSSISILLSGLQPGPSVFQMSFTGK